MKFFPSSERLRRIEYKGKEVILVDYNGLKESEMIALTNRHRDLVVAEQKESYFIAYYENTYGTPPVFVSGTPGVLGSLVGDTIDNDGL
jgi:hypothetical protein